MRFLIKLQYQLFIMFIIICPLNVYANTFLSLNSPLTQQFDNIVINEFMASNNKTIKDEDGDYSDWIELSNTGDQDIDIGGMYLTDNLTVPDKWQIPESTIIQSNGFILFWASGKNLLSHTNFKLSKDGEEIALFDASKNKIDEIRYNSQSTDISYGRDHQGNWIFFQTPTPYQINVIKYLPGDIDRSGHVDLKDALCALQITQGQYALQIPITDVDINFDSKIGIEETIYILKTLAGFGVNPDDYKYEALFKHGLLHDVEIVISQQEWDGLIADMHDYLKTGCYRKASFIYKGPMGNDVIENVGFRVKGNITRVIPQDENNQLHRAHFKVKFNETFDLQEGTTKYECQKKRRFCSLTSLIFRLNIAMPDYWDNSQIKELFCYDLLNKINVKTSRTGSSKLTINIGGKKYYFGIYTLLEPINKSFLTRRYEKKQNDGNLYKCILGDSGPASLEPVDGIDGPSNATVVFKENRIIGIKDWRTKYRPTYDLKTNEDVADHSQLLDFIHQLNTLDVNDLSENGLKYYLDSNFGMDHFLRYMAMNMLLGKWDDYWSIGNNYYLYFNPFGKIDFIPCDFDSALAGVELFYLPSQGIYDWSNHVNELISVLARVPLSILNSVKIYHSPLVEKIFQIQAYRQTYENYIKEFISGSNPLFAFEKFENKFNTLHALYSPYLDNHIDEGEEMLIEEKMSNYFHLRTESIINELDLK
ncbi:Spore coat protein CotH [Candidatus Magnetomorum sp. HK-1]|nr:Spore coat protein CotH [Candidatus Magnetomorum sp. HK-1]